MPKLTDTDLVILSAAARRGGRAALPLPKALGIKGEAATRTLDGRRKKGLLDEKPTARKAGAWRESKDGQRMMLVITDSGLKAIDGESAVQPRKQSDPARSRPKQPRPEPKTAGSRPKGQVAAPAVRQVESVLVIVVGRTGHPLQATLFSRQIAPPSGGERITGPWAPLLSRLSSTQKKQTLSRWFGGANRPAETNAQNRC